MIVRPLPKHLLIHSIVYEEYTGTDGWNETNAEPITIDFVRVESTSSMKRTSDSVSKEASHIVYVDRVNSSKYPEFKDNSTITWKGDPYTLHKVKKFHDTGELPHHYELELK